MIFSAALPSPTLAGNFYAGTSPANVPWPGGVVPYEFTNTLTTAQSNTFLAGLREWELAANVQFVPHTNQTRWILFSYNTNFLDFVSGGSYSPQMVTVSSLSRAQVCHEMGHSFGFNHENIRPDATNFISVLTNNIFGESSNIFWFTPDPTTVTNGNYDYESVMHLGWDFDSTEDGVLATQQPKPPNFPRYQYRMGNYCLSPGDRAALAYLYPPATTLTNVVTNTADVGPGSLRAAIYYATDHSGTTVRFDIPNSDPGYSNGVFNIHLTGMLPPLVANGMVIDGSTQPGFTNKPVIVVDASQIIPETFTSDTFLIYSSSNQIKNISFSGFDWNGMTLIYAAATNNTISGCWLGVDASGTNAAPNAYQGILVGSGASRNTFGPTNVISGNTQYGIYITDSNTTGNVVLGNYIGTPASGSNALANGDSGAFIGNGSSGNIIGGTNAQARNVLSGNLQYGVYITGTNTAGNLVLGNYVGTDARGSNAIPNGLSGVIIGGGAATNIIGSTNAAGRNILSGNTQYGIYLSNTVENVISGNYFGVNASGATALANQKSGIGLFGGTQNVIGGTVTGAGNVISGNGEYGIDIRNPVATGNFIEGNFIGTSAAGTNSISGSSIGVGLQGGAISNTIGGTIAGAGNVISGNLQYGIFISDAGTSNNLIQGNLIGTGTAGTNAVGNANFGIGIWSGASGNVIGGTSAGAGNVISGTTGYGYGITLGGADGNVIQGNYIGTDINGKNAIPNNFAGVALYSAAANNIIGSPGAGNVISGNGSYGIYLSDPGTTNNWIQGNIIGADATGTNALPNYIGLIVFGGTTNDIIGLRPDGSGSGNEIAFNYWDGVQVGDPSSVGIGIAIRGNSIYSNYNLGIELVHGGNNSQTNAVITNAFGCATSTIVLGELTSLASKPYTIDLYRTFAAGAGGYGQGQFYLGKVNVTTDGSGNATFAFTNNAGNYAGQYITATATDASGNTSEFSLAQLATNAPAPSAQFAMPFAWHNNGFVFNLTFATNFNYRIQATTNLAGNPIPWADLTNFTANSSSLTFTDRTATNFRARFYRVVSP